MTGTATILRGNALTLPLADASVDLIITSPPYFALRSYQDGGEHYAGQIGSEATPAEFVDALLAATAEMVRVLKPSGSLWVNLGDKYAQAEERSRNGNGNRKAIDNFPAGSVLRGPTVTLGRKDNGSVRTKSLIGIPWRYAIACIDQLGLILRAEVIWAKPNGLPESVTDRVRRSHETWFHFVRQPRYFSAVDEIREPHEVKPFTAPQNGTAYHARAMAAGEGHHRYDVRTNNPLGKLPGSVWSIPTQPLTVPAHLGVDHFAAFPMEWPRRIIQGWSPSGVCTACGEGRRPVGAADYEHVNFTSNAKTLRGAELHPGQGKRPAGIVARKSVTITGYACACPDTTASTTPAIVADFFGGTGTVALVAKALGRHGISLDMSSDYCRLATWRTTDEGEWARALQVEKPAKQVDGQLSLLEALG